MRVDRLVLHHMRRFEEAQFVPDAGFNLLVGENGAGKTTVLEALHLMAYGRSFRGRVRDGLIRQGADALDVFVAWTPDPLALPSTQRRAGMRHTGQAWSGRLDGEDVDQLGRLCAALAVVSFDPGSHALVSGSGDWRRKFMDWGLFHVEPDFLGLSRRYARALKQRNALLKSGRPSPALLDSWESELSETGEALTAFRLAYLERLQQRMLPLAADLAPSLGVLGLDFQPGWRRQELPLADALLLARERDLVLGHTTVGPHRADWSVRLVSGLGREALSRGQAKLTALIALLAQAEEHAQERGSWPVLQLDDLASELDRPHLQRVLDWLAGTGAQVVMTATERPDALRTLPLALFHVEQGQVMRSD